MSRPPPSLASPPHPPASADSFEYDSTDADDDFQLIQPNATSPPSHAAPSTTSSSSPAPHPNPLSQSTASLSNPNRRRRRHAAPSAAHSTPSLPASAAAPVPLSSTPPPADAAWGLQSHVAGYSDTDWKVQSHHSGALPHSAPSSPPALPGGESLVASGLGSSWASAGVDYEETEEMEEEHSDGFDDEAAVFPPSSSLSIHRSFTLQHDDLHSGDEAAGRGAGKEEKAETGSARESAESAAQYASGAAMAPHRVLPLYSTPHVVGYSLGQQAGAAVGERVGSGVEAGAEARSSSSAAAVSAASLPSVSKDAVPLPYFPWVSPQTLWRAGYVTVGFFVLFGLARLGAAWYYGGKAGSFQMPS